MLEEQIDRWRSYLSRRQAIHAVDVAELEDHLREQTAGLLDAGLAADEAFLVAVKRLGSLDALSREFAREHSERLWKQLVIGPAEAVQGPIDARTDAFVAFGLAAAAAVAIKVPALFGIPLVGTLLWTGRGLDIEREILIAFDLLLIVVLGLLLYSISARDRQSPRGSFDYVQVVLVISALLADGVALWAIAARISEFGLSPNRVAALGMNVLLLVNLAWSAVLYLRFLRGRQAFTALEAWQTRYLPVFAVWAAVVVIAFPPLFGYV